MPLIQKIWRVLTLHCEEASKLASESLDHRLDPTDRAASALHRLSCRPCRRHHRQILDLRSIARKMAEHPGPPAPPLPDEVREKIRQSVKEG